MSLSPYALDRHSLDFLSPLTSLDSAHDGRADAAWGEQPEDLSRAAMGKLRPTGSAPNSLSRRCARLGSLDLHVSRLGP